jgi:hypothetical protein
LTASIAQVKFYNQEREPSGSTGQLGKSLYQKGTVRMPFCAVPLRHFRSQAIECLDQLSKLNRRGRLGKLGTFIHIHLEEHRANAEP